MSRLKELRTPVFWAEGHPGRLDRESWKIEVVGLCKKPGTFTWQDLTVMPKTICEARLTSVTRFSVGGLWGGVKVADVMDAVEVDPGVKYVRFWSYRQIYDTAIPVEIARKERMSSPTSLRGSISRKTTAAPCGAYAPISGGTSRQRAW